MEKFKHNKTLFAAVLLFFLATSVYAVSPKVDKTASAKGTSPRVLLQKAIYAEETEGDLDKAIELYQQAIDRADRVQRIAARATYQLAMCYLKKGEKTKAAEYLGLVSNYPTQKAIVEKAKQQLKKLKPEKVDSVFEKISYQVLMFIADKYGKLAAEAGVKSVFCNAHVHYVDTDLSLYSGGLGYYYNWTGHPQSGKIKLSGTSYPNQTLYDTSGNKLNTEIVPDKDRNNFYHIYWIPDEPLKSQEALYYGWSKNDKRKLSPLPGSGKGMLTMQNQFGPKVIETFFLVLPPQLEVSDEATPTDSRDFGDFKVFWWTKEVAQNANHVENVVIQKRTKIENARTVAESFLSALVSGDKSEAIKLLLPDIDDARQIDSFEKLVKGKQVKIATIHGNDRIALAYSNDFADNGRVIEIVLGKDQGIWTISNIDTEPVSKAKSDMARFLSKFPDAGEVSTQISGKIVFLPDADDVIQQGKEAVVLDLATGKMLPGDKDKQYFNKLNKGDVAYFDDEGKDLLVCFRGAKITRKTANGKYSDTPDQSHTDNTTHIYIIKKTPAEWTITTKEGDIYDLKVLSLDNDQAKIKYSKIPTGGKVWTFTPDLSSPGATIKSFVKAVYDGNLEAARSCVSKDGHDYDEFKEMLATESNHPFQAMIKAMDASIPVEITRIITNDVKCKISWYLTLGRVYYFGETKIKKGMHQEFSSYLKLVGDKWLIRDI